MHLAGLSKLELLDLDGTDAGLVHLAGLTNLDALDLRSTQVTVVGLDELRKALPNCRIN